MNNATVTLVSVTIKSVFQQQTHYAQYNGTVRLRASSSGIEFDYVYPFKDQDSIANAILSATTALKNQLDALSQATQRVNRSSQQQEADYEALGEEDD